MACQCNGDRHPGHSKSAAVGTDLTAACMNSPIDTTRSVGASGGSAIAATCSTQTTRRPPRERYKIHSAHTSGTSNGRQKPLDIVVLEEPNNKLHPSSQKFYSSWRTHVSSKLVRHFLIINPSVACCNGRASLDPPATLVCGRETALANWFGEVDCKGTRLINRIKSPKRAVSFRRDEMQR